MEETALRRLRKDLINLHQNPIPHVYAAPLLNNMMEWHFLLRGPEDSKFNEGIFHGKLVFPTRFPFAPPSIYMLTPNGRFHTNMRLCFSMSDYHPELWNPTWTVGALLHGVLSFMLEDLPTYGSVEVSADRQQELVKDSLAYNLRDPVVQELFPDVTMEMRATLRMRESHEKLVADSKKRKRTWKHIGGKRATWFRRLFRKK